jgi:hypothetical protein
MNLKEVFNYIRRSEDLTVIKMRELTGFSYNSLIGWKHGRNDATYNNVLKFVDKLGYELILRKKL